MYMYVYIHNSSPYCTRPPKPRAARVARGLARRHDIGERAHALVELAGRGTCCNIVIVCYVTLCVTML